MPVVVRTPRWVMNAAGIALIVGTLYIGRTLWVPLALALLLSFVLDPLVSGLRRRHVRKSAAVALVVSVSLVIAGATSVFVASQVVVLSKNLPAYEQTIHAKLGWIRGALTRQAIVDDLARLLGLVEIELRATRHAVDSTAAPERPSLRVQVEPERPSPTRTLIDAMAPVMAPLGTAAVVVLVLIFILLERSDLRDRLLRLIGGDLHHSMALTDEAAHRVSRYLTTQLLVNLAYAAILTVGLGLIGIPGALLWGVLAGLLRFLPYLGPLLAASLPLTLAFAVDPGWSMLLWTAALISVVDLIVNYLVEPRLYGAQTGLTPIGVVLSAMFWAALWGGVGLVLATPLTVCLVVMSRHVPGLQFLQVLVGRDPVLDAPTRLYRRLRSGEVAEAIELGMQLTAAQGVVGFYHQDALPALCQAARDPAPSDSHGYRCEWDASTAVLLDHLEAAYPVPTARHGTRVLCVAGETALDALGMRILAHALSLAGHGVTPLAAREVAAESLADGTLEGGDVVCCSSFDIAPASQVQAVTRRLKRLRPDLRIVHVLWCAEPAATREALNLPWRDVALAFDLQEALACLQDGSPRAGPPPLGATDAGPAVQPASRPAAALPSPAGTTLPA